MNDRMKKAEYLFDELGLIDDAIVAQAAEYNKHSSVGVSRFRKTVIAAAAVMVFAMVFTGTLLIGFLRDRLAPRDEGSDDGVSAVYSESLSDALYKAETSGIAEECTLESVDLFDGTARIIWRREGGEYYAISLAGAEKRARLTRAVEAAYSNSESVSDGGSSDEVSVWISMGDGSVISPYLKKSDGNVGYGELFSYSPEIIPSSELTKLVDDIVADSDG
ncbi:MAG: hypothetical protein IJ038_00785 [Clostridia bacterium]|nr:hypothetical protein [Clostridia bacterium]